MNFYMDHNFVLNVFIFIGALLIHSITAVIFMYKEFATKRELLQAETHIKALVSRDFESLKSEIRSLTKVVENNNNLLLSLMDKKQDK